jgi:hypothetical protein
MTVEISSDTVTLRIPRNPRYYSVARLVVGGLAAGLDVSFDALDDLQLAISSLLDSEDMPVEGDLVMHLSVDPDSMRAGIGPFQAQAVTDAFDDSHPDNELGLQKLLNTIVDDVKIAPQADGHWIHLVKRVGALA